MVKREETDDVRPDAAARRPLDAVDRTLSGALAVDAELSYVELGERVHLSAPAVHQRVRRLKRDGTIGAIEARLDGAAIGRPLLAFVHVDTEGWGAKRELQGLLALPEFEEMHTVAGDTCLLLKVRVADSAALEGLLARLYDVPGVRGTRTQVVLSTYLERSVQAEVTTDMARWAEEKRYAGQDVPASHPAQNTDRTDEPTA